MRFTTVTRPVDQRCAIGRVKIWRTATSGHDAGLRSEADFSKRSAVHRVAAAVQFLVNVKTQSSMACQSASVCADSPMAFLRRTWSSRNLIVGGLTAPSVTTPDIVSPKPTYPVNSSARFFASLASRNDLNRAVFSLITRAASSCGLSAFFFRFSMAAKSCSARASCCTSHWL